MMDLPWAGEDRAGIIFNIKVPKFPFVIPMCVFIIEHFKITFS
jgi:hypothetical protein